MRCRVFLLFCTVLGISLAPAAHGQRQPMSVEVMKLLVEARTQPAAFLKNHKAELDDAPDEFIKALQAGKALPAPVWDTGLEAWCKAKVETGDLNPDIPSKNATCGSAAGMQSNTGGFNALGIVLDFHNNLLDPNCQYFAMYFDAKVRSYWFCWGYRCDKVKEPFSFTGKVDSSKVDFTRINTARDAKYLSAEEKRMVLEINFARAYPKVYAQVVRHELHLEAQAEGGLDHDDHVAAMELIAELEAMEPVSILQPMQCVYQAAKAHGIDCERRGFIDHTGSDGSDPWDRILGQCTELDHGNENLVGGHDTPRRSLISLLVDGGISSRGHRHNALDPDWRYVGVYRYGMGPQIPPEYAYWVHNFAN